MLETEIKRSLAAGDKQARKFTGSVRSVDSTALMLGDTWTFPETYTIMDHTFSSGRTIQYVFIEVDGRTIPFYPTTFTKSRRVYNEDKTATDERKTTAGTAAEKYREFPDIQSAMDALKGKKCTVSNVEIIRTLDYNTREVVDTRILTIDFVEDKK